MAEVAYNQNEFDYRREPGANQSSLKKILDSPAHYQAALKFKMIPTPAMEMGTALHCISLDGQKAFDAGYIKKPEGIRLNTKEGKEAETNYKLGTQLPYMMIVNRLAHYIKVLQREQIGSW